ncbi:hypothetical protein GCM10010524_23560 [Streptomyces mexicanus]
MWSGPRAPSRGRFRLRGPLCGPCEDWPDLVRKPDLIRKEEIPAGRIHSAWDAEMLPAGDAPRPGG